MWQEVASKRVGRGANKRRRGTRGRRGTRSRGGRVRQGNRRGLEVSRGKGRSRGRQEVGGEGLGGSTWGRGPSTCNSLRLAGHTTSSRHKSHTAPISTTASISCCRFRRRAAAGFAPCTAPLTPPTAARALRRIVRSWLSITLWQKSVTLLCHIACCTHTRHGMLPARRSGARLWLRMPGRTATSGWGLHGACSSHAR